MDLNSLNLEITIVLGISGGLLSLVGLIAIFVTLNSQQNIEKAREIIWRLEEFPIEFSKGSSTAKLTLDRLLLHYEKIINTGKPTKMVIYLTLIILALVGSIWNWAALYIDARFPITFFVTASTFILFLFGITLVLLTKIIYISELPTYEEVITSTLNNNSNIIVSFLLVTYIDIYFPSEIADDEKHQVWCLVKLPSYYKTKVRVYYHHTGLRYDNLEFTYRVILINDMNNRHYTMGFYHEDEPDEISEHQVIATGVADISFGYAYYPIDYLKNPFANLYGQRATLLINDGIFEKAEEFRELCKEWKYVCITLNVNHSGVGYYASIYYIPVESLDLKENRIFPTSVQSANSDNY